MADDVEALGRELERYVRRHEWLHGRVNAAQRPKRRRGRANAVTSPKRHRDLVSLLKDLNRHHDQFLAFLTANRDALIAGGFLGVDETIDRLKALKVAGEDV